MIIIIWGMGERENIPNTKRWEGHKHLIIKVCGTDVRNKDPDVYSYSYFIVIYIYAQPWVEIYVLTHDKILQYTT